MEIENANFDVSITLENFGLVSEQTEAELLQSIKALSDNAKALSDTATFTATVDHWQSDGNGAGMDGSSLKFYRKDITDEVGIDLVSTDNGDRNFDTFQNVQFDAGTGTNNFMSGGAGQDELIISQDGFSSNNIDQSTLTVGRNYAYTDLEYVDINGNEIISDASTGAVLQVLITK